MPGVGRIEIDHSVGQPLDRGNHQRLDLDTVAPLALQCRRQSRGRIAISADQGTHRVRPLTTCPHALRKSACRPCAQISFRGRANTLFSAPRFADLRWHRHIALHLVSEFALWKLRRSV